MNGPKIYPRVGRKPKVIHRGSPALDSLAVEKSRFWIEKARRKRQKKCAFLIARSYGPGLKNRLH